MMGTINVGGKGRIKVAVVRAWAESWTRRRNESVERLTWLVSYNPIQQLHLSINSIGYNVNHTSTHLLVPVSLGYHEWRFQL